MGSAVGACLLGRGLEVLWCPEGRSDESRGRAEESGLTSRSALGSLIDDADVMISIVPPHAAFDVAQQVASRAFEGLYIDANAIAPETAQDVATMVQAAGATYIDGSLIGPPPKAPGDTRLYLSGGAAPSVASLFDGTILDARVTTGGGAYAASAIKMAYAGWTKGTAAMLLAIRQYAKAAGVEASLIEEWEGSIPELPARSEWIRDNVHAKAWRYVGEMEEIAKALEAEGMPGGFHEAAAAVYRAVRSRPS